MEERAGARGSAWRSWLLRFAILLALISLADAFLVDRPVAAIVYGILVGVGAYWLSRTDGIAPVVYLGSLMLLELLAVLFVYPDEGESLDARSLLFAIVTAAGAVSALVILVGSVSGRARGG